MAENAIIDISIPVYEGMLHPGRQPRLTHVERLEDGGEANVTRWQIGAHTGTHLEAPLHTRSGGAAIDELPLDLLVGPARVLDVTGVAAEIEPADLEAAGFAGEERVLLQTRNSTTALKSENRPETWVGLTPAAARFLVEGGVRLIGIDFYTIETPGRDKSFDSHYILSEAGVVTIEQVDLAAAEPGVYELVCLPIPLTGSEAAPARAILLPEGSSGGVPVDLSIAVEEGMLHWGKRPRRDTIESFDDGDNCNVTRWEIGSHTGLHFDAPRHFDDDGVTVGSLDLESLVGPARVLDLTAIKTEITGADLEAAGLGEEPRVLLRTRNSEGALREKEKPAEWIGLAPDAAELLIARGVRVVGIDFLTIEAPSREGTWETHLTLLPAGVVVIECVDLSGVEAGVYDFVGLPVNLRDSEAAPGGGFLRPLAS